MTLAEQFKCEIPTPDALKEGVLYCSTNATNWTDIWTAVASAVTAVATVGLLLGVWGAFKQIKEGRRIHDDQQQLDALARYISAIQYFGDLQATTEDELTRASTEVRTAGALFRLTFRIVESNNVGSLQRFDEILLKFVMLEFERRDQGPYQSQRASYAQAIAQLTAVAVDTLPKLRLPDFTLENLRTTLTKAANEANEANPDSDIEAMVLGSIRARRSQ
ncbi:hypothetical protein ACT17S_00365 [Glutamicibacter mysorens]